MSKEHSKQTILINLIAIQNTFGAGTVSAFKVYSAFCNAGLLDVDLDILINSSALNQQQKNKLSAFDKKKATEIIRICAESEISLLAISDDDFPMRLRNISVPPLVLYIKGKLPKIDAEPIISIVGPRKASEFGAKAAYSLAYRLAKAGFIVVSGAAIGCDTAAHKGALKSGRTIAVLGCGINYDYLPENRNLRNRIAENCCIISEYPPNAPTGRYTFPIRNRLISGLSLGTVVIEAREKSGSLITARYANEQGRDVFVIPGNPTFEYYKGSNALLRDGAHPLIDASDIFNEYVSEFSEKIDLKAAFSEENNEKSEEKIQKKSDKGLSNEAKIVYNNLNKQNFTADDLWNCGVTDDEILSALTELEMEHFIKALPGGNYVLIKP